MTDREKLTQAIYDMDFCSWGWAQKIADHLIANGVKIPVLCKDCTSYNTKGCASGFGWCVAWDQGRMDYNFCHCGERKGYEGN